MIVDPRIDTLHVTHILTLHVTFEGAMRMADSVVERVRNYRQGLRDAGLRPIQIWVPDTRAAGFADECNRQSRVIRESKAEHDMLDFIEQVADLDDAE
jgi:hypothetical protein